MSRIYKFLEDGLFYRDLNNKDYIQYSVDEALDELEELKRDVKDFVNKFEVYQRVYFMPTIYDLSNKLRKVGDKDE